MSTFVKESEVEQEQFDWGTIGWRCRPANTGSKALVVLDVTLEPGEGHAFHKHPGQEEMIIVKEGEITQFLERESTTLKPGDSVYIDEGIVGFYGASSMERLPVEEAMTENMRRFKSIPVKEAG